jgi:anthranilate phosphoribosyltransferase
VVHGADGLDEVTTTGRTHAALLAEGHVSCFEIDPGQYGIPPTVAGALRGGDAAENAAIVRSVLEGETGARRDIVLLNAASALWVSEAATDIDDGLAQARDSVAGGAALRRLDALVAASIAAAEAVPA